MPKKKQTEFRTPMLGKSGSGAAKSKRTIGKGRGAQALDDQGRAYAESGLPVNSLIRAIGALSKAGKITQAVALESRLAAKVLGKKNPFRRGLSAAQSDANVTRALGKRRASEGVFPRLPNVGGDSPRLLRGSKDLRTFDKYADLTNEGAGRFARGTKRGNKLVKAIEKNEVQSGMYIGSKEAIKRAAFNSTRPVAKLPRGK